jgi:hypothetical protein
MLFPIYGPPNGAHTKLALNAASHSQNNLNIDHVTYASYSASLICWITRCELSEAREQTTNNIEIVFDLDELGRQTDGYYDNNKLPIYC